MTHGLQPEATTALRDSAPIGWHDLEDVFAPDGPQISTPGRTYTITPAEYPI
jgi:hypothetical protein